MKAVQGNEDCMIITNDGIVIRISLTQVSVYSRGAQGVRLINVGDDKMVSSVAIVSPEESEETSDTEETTEATTAETTEETKE